VGSNRRPILVVRLSIAGALANLKRLPAQVADVHRNPNLAWPAPVEMPDIDRIHVIDAIQHKFDHLVAGHAKVRFEPGEFIGMLGAQGGGDFHGCILVSSIL